MSRELIARLWYRNEGKEICFNKFKAESLKETLRGRNTNNYRGNMVQVRRLDQRGPESCSFNFNLTLTLYRTISTQPFRLALFCVCCR